jgi:hypothetical protein
MPLKSAPYYWVECDNCGNRIDYGDFSALADDGQAVDGALDSEWTTDGDRWHCFNCPTIAKCDRCGKPAGDQSGDRDYNCEVCWAEIERDRHAVQ